MLFPCQEVEPGHGFLGSEKGRSKEPTSDGLQPKSDGNAFFVAWDPQKHGEPRANGKWKWDPQGGALVELREFHHPDTLEHPGHGRPDPTRSRVNSVQGVALMSETAKVMDL